MPCQSGSDKPALSFSPPLMMSCRPPSPRRSAANAAPTVAQATTLCCDQALYHADADGISVSSISSTVAICNDVGTSVRLWSKINVAGGINRDAAADHRPVAGSRGWPGLSLTFVVSLSTGSDCQAVSGKWSESLPAIRSSARGDNRFDLPRRRRPARPSRSPLPLRDAVTAMERSGR